MADKPPSPKLRRIQTSIEFFLTKRDVSFNRDGDDAPATTSTPEQAELCNILDNITASAAAAAAGPAPTNADAMIQLEYDPGHQSRYIFSSLPDKQKDFIINRGPFRPDYDAVRKTTKIMPRQSRYFQKRWYSESDWVEYSVLENSVYCFPCRLFPTDSGNARKTFTSEGLTDFSNADKAFGKHVNSEGHLFAYARWKEYRSNSVPGSNISSQLSKQLHEQQTEAARAKAQLCKVLVRILSAIKFLAKQSLAFRGHDETDESINSGNFLELIKYTAEFDEVLSTHLQSTSIKPGQARKHKTYLSKDSQNVFIQLLSDHLLRTLASKINSAIHYCLQIDGTRDLAGHEQISLVLRIADERGVVQQYFLGFYQCASQTSESLEQFVVSVLENLRIPLENCRCVNFDGASNMSGRVNGLQARIRKLVPRVIFFHCAAHRLNLVVVAACRCIAEAANFFGIVQSVYNFIANAPTRRLLFEEGWRTHCEGKQLTLKKLCEVRWGCQRRALRVMVDGYAAVLYALENFLETSPDPKTRAEANGLLKQVESFEFAFLLHLFYPLLEMTGVVSDRLSSENLDLLEMLTLINGLRVQLNQERSGDSDAGFRDCWTAATKFADKHEINIPTEISKRRTYVSRRTDENPNNQHFHANIADYFRCNVYNTVLDKARTCINERFNDESVPLIIAFSAVFPKHLLHDSSEDSLKKITELVMFYGDDFSSVPQVCSQWKLFRCICCSDTSRGEVEKCKSISHLVAWICSNNHDKAFPQVFHLYRLLLTLGLATVKNERTFSKLKLIETHLRTSMRQERLSALGLLSVEREELDKMNLELIAKNYVEKMKNY